MPQEYWTDELMEIAKKFMLEYLKSGIKQPGNFDEIIGCNTLTGFDLGTLLSEGGIAFTWNQTIFCTALGKLVDEGKVKFWQEDPKGYFYELQD